MAEESRIFEVTITHHVLAVVRVRDRDLQPGESWADAAEAMALEEIGIVSKQEDTDVDVVIDITAARGDLLAKAGD